MAGPGYCPGTMWTTALVPGSGVTGVMVGGTSGQWNQRASSLELRLTSSRLGEEPLGVVVRQVAGEQEQPPLRSFAAGEVIEHLGTVNKRATSHTLGRAVSE